MNLLSPSKNTVLIAAAVIVLFAVMAFMDLANQTYSGYNTDPNDNVVQVRPDSPAEAAGLAVGDRIVSSGGISVNDTKALSRRARAEVGQSRDYVVERDGQEQTLSITFAALPGRQRMLSILGLLTGLCFLVFGLRPFLRGKNEMTALLAVVSICFALLFVGPPYFSSYAIRTVLGVISLPIALLGFAGLLHFMLSFPRKSAWLDKPNALRTLYGPAVLIAAYLLFLTIVQPDGSSVLNTVTNVALGLFFVSYFGLCVAVMVRTYLRASAEDRSAFGLNVMVAGVVLALLPVVVSIAVNVVAPHIILPGRDYFIVSFILLPLSFGFAAMKAQDAQPEAA